MKATGKAQIIRALIEQTQSDFVSFYAGTAKAERANELMSWALAADRRLLSCVNDVEAMLPNTEGDDGSGATSYALNAGVMMLCLIDAMSGQADSSYDEAVTAFFDTVDFRACRALEAELNRLPTEEEIASHPFSQQACAWFAEIAHQIND